MDNTSRICGNSSAKKKASVPKASQKWHGNGWRVGAKYFKQDRKCYYCIVTTPKKKRKDYKLLPDSEKSEELRREIINQFEQRPLPSDNSTLEALARSFLGYVKRNQSESTYILYKYRIRTFVSSVGRKTPLYKIRLQHAQRWLTSHHPQCSNPNTRYSAIKIIKRMFNWAAHDMEYIGRNPLAKLKRPRQTCRTTCLTKEQWDKVFTLYPQGDCFLGFLKILTETGCRPQEIRIIEARHINLENSTATFQDGEIPGKQWGRIVKLTSEATAMLEKQMLIYPEGPLFRNLRGKPWNPNSLKSRFHRLKQKLRQANLNFRVTGYTARHSWCTDLIEAGASEGAVAAEAGHRDPTVVLQFYGKHIEERERHLRDLVEKSRQRPVNPIPFKNERGQ